MKYLTTITAMAAAISLAACSDDTSTQTAEPVVPEKSQMEEAEKTVTAVAEKAAEIAESLKLDTSSLSAFKASLNDMKASLNGDQTSQLTSALTSLVKDGSDDKKGLLSAAKNVASGKSLEETLYENMGDKLNGLSFEDVLKLAN